MGMLEGERVYFIYMFVLSLSVIFSGSYPALSWIELDHILVDRDYIVHEV